MLVRRGATRMFSDGFTDIVWEPRLGAGVALQQALDHPDRVGRIILACVSYASDGNHAEISDPAQHATSTRMPTAEDFQQMYAAYARLAPDPGHGAVSSSRPAGRAGNGAAPGALPHRRPDRAARDTRPR
jgi:pimeloyl-ACP methyl ester carboxylesterase